LVIVIDTREQRPYGFGDKVSIQRKALQTGDYSVAGLENEIAIERKSLDDLIGSLSAGRERFNKELERLKHYPVKAIVCEAAWCHVITGDYRSKMSPAAAYGSIIGIIAMGIPVVMAGGRMEAERACYSILRIAYNRYQAKLHHFSRGKIIKASENKINPIAVTIGTGKSA
jgi:ERCC4-type nuclease